MMRSHAILVHAFLVAACNRAVTEEPSPTPSAPASVGVNTAPPYHRPEKVEVVEKAMGTEIHVVSYTTPEHGADDIRAATRAAVEEIRRLEQLMSSWRPDTEIGRINAGSKEPISVSPETFEVIEKSLWVSGISDGVFDITVQPLMDVWKFGDAAEDPPRLPDPSLVSERRALVDHRKVKLDTATRSITLPQGMKIDLGGIAKGYAVDRASAVLKGHGIISFLVQAGGDLYGAGRKPDGSAWVSGIQDPRAEKGIFFATIELTDRSFSTAGDYARSFVVGGKRYHHIVDPRSGYPATACRSVTVWAKDAFLADAVDDAVFILGPTEGSKLVESLPDVGAVIVDAENQVIVSPRLKGKVVVQREPTDGI